MNKMIEDGINWIIERFKKDQSHDGSWAYPFETGCSTDAYMIILLRTLSINDEDLIRGIAARLTSKQEKNGAWKLFYDEGDGNLSATVEAYYALLYSGFLRQDDERILAAKTYILANGGIEKVSTYTKIMLAITGQYRWPRFPPIPVELMLLPQSFPVNFYEFSVFGRANLAPIMILAAKKFTLKTANSPDLSGLRLPRTEEDPWLRSPEWGSLLKVIEDGIKRLIGVPQQLHSLAMMRAKKYLLDHIEPDGTLSSYFSSTFLMIFALLALETPKNAPVITKAIAGLKAMKTIIDGFPHMQYTTATVWNTALISYALQFSGIDVHDSVVQKANHYLLSRQHHKFGDWVIHNPNSFPGGWGFSDINTINPDVDDTTASLRAIARTVKESPDIRTAWHKGITWLFSMQNEDGGWAAFEKNVNHPWLGMIPVEKGEFLLSDPSCADITGRTLEFFGNYTNLANNHPVIKNGVTWLLNNQEKDGSWYGRWGICYLYGTWAAITGLCATGVPATHRSLQKAVSWLKVIQNSDGGWGESCRSDIQKTYVPLRSSTLTHTAWALDALITVSKEPNAEINSGISYLLKSLTDSDWTTDYPKGQGMAGGFYIHYHSYRYIFPLIALSHYQRKFPSKK